MSDTAALTPFDEIENSDEFKALPLKDQLTVIDGWADEVIESNGYAESKEVVDFTEKVKSDYKSRAISDVIAKKLPPVTEGALTQSDLDARKADAETMFQGAFDDALRQKSLSERTPQGGTISASTPAAIKFEAQDPELSGMITDLLFDDKTRKATQPVDLDLGDGVKIKASRIAHPGKDLFEFVLPGGKRVVEESSDMSTAAKAAVEKNLDAFPDTGGDIVARLGQGVLKDFLIKRGEGVAALVGMTGTRALIAPDVLASGMIGRATGSYPETMAPLVEATRQMQAGVINKTRADTLNAIVDRIAPVNPQATAETFVGQGNDITRQLPRVIGQGIGNIVVGLATGGAAPGVLFASNIAAMGNAAAEEAVAAGKPEEAMSAFLETGLAGGAVETATDLFFTKAFKTAFGRTLDISSPGASARLAKRFKEGLSSAGLGGVQEGVAEGVQTAIANDVARRHYDENRSLFKGVDEAAAIGALTGFILGGGSSAVGVGKEAIAISKEKKTTNEEENLQPSIDPETQGETGQAPQVNEPASVPEPDLDDAPVRSVIEEFTDEESDAEIAPVETEAVAEVGTETVETPIPPSPIEEISPVDEPAPAQTPAPLETPAIADEEVNTPDADKTVQHKGSEGVKGGRGILDRVKEMSLDEFSAFREDLQDRVFEAEKDPGRPLTDADKETLKQGGWRAFSESRGYTPEEIQDYSDWLDVVGRNSYLTESSELYRQHTEKPDTSTAGAMEPVRTFDIADTPLEIKIYQNEDGTARLEKVNTETGKVIPVEGAEQSFPSYAEAFDFHKKTFTPEQKPVEAVPKTKDEIESFTETDPLMLWPAANPVSPVQDNIKEIGNIARRKDKGLRAMGSDQSGRAKFDDVPLVGDYTGLAQERLRKIYKRGSAMSADVAATRIYEQDPSLIAGPFANDLWDAIKNRLEKVGGENQITSGDQAQAASDANNAALERDYTNFMRDLKSPYRRGGLIEAGALQVGDVLEVAGYPATVTGRDDDGVAINSKEYGEITVGLEEKVGYDSIAENGIPESERENIAAEDRVTREEAAELTAYLRSRLNLRGGDSQARVVPSREHSAVAKNRRELEAARRIARFFDSRLVGVDGLPSNGAISRAEALEAQKSGKKKSVYLATDANRLEVLLVNHELLHVMRVTDPDLYEELLATMGVTFDADGNLPRDADGNRVLGADLERYIREVRPEHASVSDDVLVEEYLADLLAERGGTNEFWEGLAMRDPELFERFVNFVLDFLRQVADRIKNDRVKVERYLRDQAAMRTAMEDVLIAFKARQSQDRKGILDVPLDESMPFADVRFADERATKPNQQVFGQDIGREDEIQSKEEVQAAVKPYFDGDSAVSYWSKDAAFAVLADIEGGRIDPTAETGLDGANQALVSELWKFANAALREDGDASLLNRMRGRVNDYWNREATRAARALNARGWASTPMEGTLAKVEESKKATVEKIEPGTEIVADIEKIQSDVDANTVKVEDFSLAETAEIAATVKGKRRTSEPSAPETAGEIALSGGQKKVGRNLRKVASKLDALLNADNDVLFADARVDDGNRRTLVQKLIADQAQTGKRKRGAFIKVAMELGLTEEVAANRFDRIAEIRAEAKAARELDAKEAAQEKAEPTTEEKLLAELDEEASRLDRLNAKADKIWEKTNAGPKKRIPKQHTDPLDKMIADAINAGTSREENIKSGLRMGLNQEAAARMADVITIKINEIADRRKKGDKKSIGDQARDIARRFDNPQDRPVREKNLLRVLINETLREKSTVTEQGFIDRMRGLGASKADSADLWASVSRERVKRQEIRVLKRREARERQERNASQKEAETLIKNLARSQSDTQDNRARPSRDSIIKELYRDLIGYGPTRSKAAFTQELEALGVDSNTANRLFEVGMKERQNRTVMGTARDANRVFGRPDLPATDRSVPFIMREILNHPQLRLVGPEERLRMMSALFRERAGLSETDARVAATKFDSILVKKWEEAALRLAEETATKRNAPWFRREPGTGTTTRPQKTTFDRIREAIRAGAMDPRKRILDEVAKSNGWMDLTDVELQRLSELDALLAEPGITLLEKTRAQREMVDVINASALPLTVTGVLKTMYIANSFSGVSTMLIGSLSGAFEGAMALPRDALLAVTGVSEARNLTGLVTTWGRIPRYISEALVDAAVTFRTGEVRIELAEEFRNASSDLDRIWSKYTARLTNPRSTVAQKSGALNVLIGALGRFTLRILSTFDSLTRGYLNRYTTEMEAFSRAAGLGMTRDQISAMIGTVQQNAQMFKEDAVAKGFTSKSDILAYVSDKTAQSIYAALEGKGIDMKAIQKRSANEASLATGMGTIEHGWLGIGQMADSVKDWSQGDTLGALGFKVFIPVVTTPYNYYHRGAWFTPYALPRIIDTAFQTKGFKDWSKSRYQNSMANPTQLAMRSAEALVGNLLFGGIAAAFFDQLGEEDEEKKWLRINLFGPPVSDRARRSAWLEDGNRPFAIQIKVGGKWVSVGFRRGGLEIFNAPFTMLGAVQQSRITGDPYLATLAKEVAGEAFFFLRFLSRGYGAESIGSEAGYRLSGFIPVSALLKTPNRFRDMQEKPEGFLESFKMQMPIVPMLSESRPALNSLGQPVGFNESSGGYMQSKINIPIGTVPVASRNRTAKNPSYGDMLILMNDKGAFPSQYPKYALDDFLKRASTDVEFYDFTKLRGEMILDQIKENYVELWALEPARFKKVLDGFKDKATDRAKKTIRARGN